MLAYGAGALAMPVLIKYVLDKLSQEPAAAGVSPSSSSYANNVSRLSSFGLIRYPEQGMVAATELLFPPDPSGLRARRRESPAHLTVPAA